MVSIPGSTAFRSVCTALAALFIAGCIAACGGGGGGGSTTAAASSVTLTGVAAVGPLQGALVTAYPVSDAGVVASTEIAHATTDAAGKYSLSVGSYAGTVQLVVTAPAGTTSADEATGAAVSLPAGFKLHANTVVNAGSGSQSQSASLTAFTELAHSIATGAGGITPANIVNANGVVFTLIGMDPVATVPVASNVAPPAGTSEIQIRYGLFNAAVSQLAAAAPTTTDGATLACYSAAGSNAGARIQCAAQQVASAVTVTGSGAQAAFAGNSKLVGLAGALVAASASSSINKTGLTIAATDSYVQTLQVQEAASASGTPAPITGGAITQARDDVATAKLFFSALRSNAAELKTGPVSTGITDGVKAFGDSLHGDVSALMTTTLDLMRLVGTAQKLWIDYKTTRVTTNPNSVDNPDPYTGCTVFEGDLANFGGAAGAAGQPYVGGSTPAASADSAKWVGCSASSGPLPTDGSARYRQTIVLNMSADPTLASVPYLAITRSQYQNLVDGQTYQQNLTPTFTGTAGYTHVNGSPAPNSLVGDLPPATTPAGVLLAARYPVNLAYTTTAAASGATQASFSALKLSVVPVNATAATLTIDLASGTPSSAVIPNDKTNAAQVAATTVTLNATIAEPDGSLTGALTAGQFKIASGGGLDLGHFKFTGSFAVAPVVAGSAGALVTWAGLTLEATNGSAPVFSFSGHLNLPQLPTLTVQGSITETLATDSYALQASYVQNGLNVAITGTQTPTSQSITAADASGVSATVTRASNASNVTVSGRQTAVINKGSNLITYSDGTFETLINP